MTYIHPTAIIGANVKIEEDCYIGPYCVIGYPAEWKGQEHEDKGVLIKRGSRLTGLVTVDSGVNATTIIGEDCYLMKHSHVGHDAVIGNNVTISCGAKVGGHAWIQDCVNIGLNACIHQRVVVPENCMIGMGGIVTKKSPINAGYKYAGNPVRVLGRNVK